MYLSSMDGLVIPTLLFIECSLLPAVFRPMFPVPGAFRANVPCSRLFLSQCSLVPKFFMNVPCSRLFWSWCSLFPGTLFGSHHSFYCTVILGIKSRKFHGISQDFVGLVGFVPSYLNVGIMNSLPYFIFFVDFLSAPSDHSSSHSLHHQ